MHLNNDVISCAALDVYDQEPLPKDHILRKDKKFNSYTSYWLCVRRSI